MSCNYGGSFLESDESFATSLHLISIFEAPVLIFGIYIVLTKTPKIMEKVKFPIIVLHLIYRSVTNIAIRKPLQFTGPRRFGISKS
ncbi:unnamed protein product [Caenorhabditis nigoni]